jgi:hypothetical protein
MGSITGPVGRSGFAPIEGGIGLLDTRAQPIAGRSGERSPPGAATQGNWSDGRTEGLDPGIGSGAKHALGNAAGPW